MSLSLAEFYHKQLKYQRSCATASKLLIVIIMFANLAWLPILAWFDQKQMRDVLLTEYLINTPFFLTFLLLVWMKYRKIRKTQTSSPEIAIAPEQVAVEVEKIIDGFADQLSLVRKPLRVLLHRRNFGFGPSVWEEKTHIDVLIPLGFLKILRTSRPQAEAMLAHEIGHIRAADTRQWAISSAFFTVMTKMFIPLLFLAIIFTIGIACYNQAKISGPNRKAYEQSLANLDLQYGQQYSHMRFEDAQKDIRDHPGFISYTPGINIDTATPKSLYIGERELLEDNYKRSGVQWWYVAGNLVLYGLDACVIFMFFTSLRASRRRSETLADLTAFSLVGSGPLLACLSSTSKDGFKILSIHPSHGLRRSNVNRFQTALEKIKW
jgi:hypothetical protein